MPDYSLYEVYESIKLTFTNNSYCVYILYCDIVESQSDQLSEPMNLTV